MFHARSPRGFQPTARPTARGDLAAADCWLEPLAPHHATALAWQYRDPAIAERTLLPPMHGPDAGAAWVADRLRQPVLGSVLMARGLGLVGYAEWVTDGEAGFLCLWIGTDWQGRGLGRRLVTMACDRAARQGLHPLFTAALDDNHRSLAALRAGGFADLPLRALPPDHDRVFLVHGEQAHRPAAAVRRLVLFSDAMQTGLAFAPPCAKSMAPSR